MYIIYNNYNYNYNNGSSNNNSKKKIQKINEYSYFTISSLTLKIIATKIVKKFKNNLNIKKFTILYIIFL